MAFLMQRFRALASEHQYARASAWYVAANIIGNGVVLFSAAVFTRLMTKEEYGIFSTYAAWVLVLNTFIGLNLFITVRNAYIDHRQDYSRYCSSVLLLALVANACITALVLLLSAVLPLGFSAAEAVFACIQASSLHVINYRLAILSMENRYRRRSLLIVLPNVAHTALSVVLILLFRSHMVLARIAGNSLGLLAFAVICLITVFSASAPLIRPDYWRYALKIALPSILHTLSDLVLIQSDRLMLTSMVNAEATAEYSLIYNVGAIIVALYQAINGAWTPWFFQRAARGERELSRNCQVLYLYAFTLITAGVVAVSPELIRILSPRIYWAGLRYVGWISIASFCMYLGAFFSTWLLSQKKNGMIARNTMIAALANLLLNYLLIPSLHATGAVIATVAGYGLLLALHAISCGREGREFFSQRSCLLFLGITAAWSLTSAVLRDYWVIRWLLYAVLAAASLKFYGLSRLRIFLKQNDEE